MSQLVENDALVQQAYQEFQRFTADEEMREKVRQRQRFLEDYQIGMDAAKDEGRSERDIAIAQNMKRKGYPTDEISEMTGLSSDEIAGLE